MYGEYFERHSKIALQFSGGKDSCVLLHLLEPYLDQLTVVWANSGDAAKETLDQMARVRDLVPHFLEVKSDQPKQIDQFGYPTDIMSIWDSMLGRQLDETRTYKLQPAISCCWENLFIPLYDAMKEGGFTLVIRGQRDAEAKKAPIRSGESEHGIEYWFPLEDWTDEKLWKYITDAKIELPTNYGVFDSSMDCLRCTAYLEENQGKLGYLKQYYPAAAAEVAMRLRYIRSSVRAELKHIEEALEDYA
jgi:phosphoadenosine phosphosulfate reductase